MTAFIVVVFAALLLFTGLVGDGGSALATRVRALDEASEAARAGAEQLDVGIFHRTGTRVLDETAATAAAKQYLAATGDSGTVTSTTDAVTVTVAASHHTWLLELIGMSTMTMHAAATAHPESANS
ncbi:pilus assembly protein TadG-related protein [Catenulispora rubra]|uniref:pilus assembly protein TadG-related protein n=1 Tax=Catenulispora rubra TaxID=280293 RepID=UPI002B274E47|nr:pilus assembly protein TadG-related protein [Catenulispora rubra]